MKLPHEFDLHSLEIFLLTVELGGMSQCAIHLQVTQSAVSQTISKLEKSIGATLFDRSLRPLGLTASGKSLFDRGQRLVAHAKATYDDVREGANLPIASITVAMSFSLANKLTAPILNTLGDRADRWSIRSGISLEHQGEFLARDIDMLVSGSFNLEHRDGVEVHPVFEESFVILLPAHYRDAIDLSSNPPKIPFIRFSHLTGMGQQIERQIVRMKLDLPHVVEIESSHQQMALVSSGFGWAITSPACLAAQPELLSHMRIAPMPRGRFARRVQVVARAGELGDLPREMATLARSVFRDSVFPPLIAQYPMLESQLVWTDGSSDANRLASQ